MYISVGSADPIHTQRDTQRHPDTHTDTPVGDLIRRPLAC
jgi:hypothetical protein